MIQNIRFLSISFSSLIPFQINYSNNRRRTKTEGGRKSNSQATHNDSLKVYRLCLIFRLLHFHGKPNTYIPIHLYSDQITPREWVFHVSFPKYNNHLSFWFLPENFKFLALPAMLLRIHYPKHLIFHELESFQYSFTPHSYSTEFWVPDWWYFRTNIQIYVWYIHIELNAVRNGWMKHENSTHNNTSSIQQFGKKRKSFCFFILPCHPSSKLLFSAIM